MIRFYGVCFLVIFSIIVNYRFFALDQSEQEKQISKDLSDEVKIKIFKTVLTYFYIIV